MKRLITILTIVFLAAISCDNKDLEQIYTKQEANIDSYINKQFKDMPVFRRFGSNRVTADTVRISYSDSLEFGDSLYFYYAGYVFNTQPTSLFATNMQQVAEQNKLILDTLDFSVKKILYTPNSLVEGLTNGLYNVKMNEHCVILFSGKHGFGNKIVNTIPKNSALAYEIWVQDIIKN